MATIECQKKNVYNVTITIKAIPCDGVYECQDDEDENNCSLPDFILIVALVVITIAFGTLGFLSWESTIQNLPVKSSSTAMHNLETLHGTDSLRKAMFQAQTLHNVESINSELINVEMKVHHGVMSEVVCCIKVIIFK